jgi:hypothetical protein
MVVNDDAFNLEERGALRLIASRLAPTGGGWWLIAKPVVTPPSAAAHPVPIWLSN